MAKIGSMTNKIRTAMVGCGGAAWVGHLPWLWENPHIDLVAVCDPNSDRGTKAAERWNVPHVYQEFDKLLGEQPLDAVVIATPPQTHHDLAVAALQKGLHVLVEKPLAVSTDQCDSMIAAAGKAEKILTVSHEKRFNPGFEKVHQIIHEGLLGDVFYLAVHWSAAVRLDPDSLSPPDYRSSYEWRWTDPESGGGIVFDHLPHYLDLWRWWTGSEMATVCAELLNVRKDWIGDAKLGGPHEDFGTALMKFENGCIGMFETGNAGRGLSPIQMVGSGIGEWSEYGMIYGTRGHLIFDLLPWDSPEMPRIMMYSLEDKAPNYRGWFQVEMADPWRGAGGPLAPKSNSHYHFKRQMDDFASAILDNRNPQVTASDGRETVAAVEAVYESFQTGKKITLNHAAK